MFDNSVVIGAIRGVVVEVITYPFDVCKVRRQGNGPIKNGGFYNGFGFKLLREGTKHGLIVPAMVNVPLWFKSYGISDTFAQMLTGLSIATADVLITMPLEGMRIKSMVYGKTPLKISWQGCSTYWLKRTVGLVTFLPTQKYLRDQVRTSPEQKLSVSQMLASGALTALGVGVVVAPFDRAHTLRQTQNMMWQEFFKLGVRKWYRGAHLNMLALLVHGTASVIILEQLGN